ncbi:MAG: hypothetical protein NVSMB17_02260 [Candidatus Dormibacteria bacterium]
MSKVIGAAILVTCLTLVACGESSPGATMSPQEVPLQASVQEPGDTPSAPPEPAYHEECPPTSAARPTISLARGGGAGGSHGGGGARGAGRPGAPGAPAPAGSRSFRGVPAPGSPTVTSHSGSAYPQRVSWQGWFWVFVAASAVEREGYYHECGTPSPPPG